MRNTGIPWFNRPRREERAECYLRLITRQGPAARPEFALAAALATLAAAFFL